MKHTAALRIVLVLLGLTAAGTGIVLHLHTQRTAVQPPGDAPSAVQTADPQSTALPTAAPTSAPTAEPTPSPTPSPTAEPSPTAGPGQAAEPGPTQAPAPAAEPAAALHHDHPKPTPPAPTAAPTPVPTPVPTPGPVCYHGNGTDSGVCTVCGLIYGPAGGSEGQYSEADGMMD